MQLGKKTDILSRMDKCANCLYEAYKMETILIEFMNHYYINEDNRSQFSIKIVCDSEGALIKEKYNIEVLFVNLKEEIEKIKIRKKYF